MTNEFISIKDWARSAGKRQIELYSSKELSNIAPGQAVLYIGGVHGDEPEGVRLAKDWLNKLNTSSFPISEYRDWALIPCLNPDGFSKNQRTNDNGVDLNRNFPSLCWSPEAKAERYYPGKKAGSEPETIALAKLINKLQPKWIIHFHSWNPCIVYSNPKIKSLAEAIAKDVSYELQEDIGYPTPGSLGEYAGKDLGIGVICIEEQEGIELDSIFPRFESALEKSLSLQFD